MYSVITSKWAGTKHPGHKPFRRTRIQCLFTKKPCQGVKSVSTKETRAVNTSHITVTAFRPIVNCFLNWGGFEMASAGTEVVFFCFVLELWLMWWTFTFRLWSETWTTERQLGLQLPFLSLVLQNWLTTTGANNYWLIIKRKRMLSHGIIVLAFYSCATTNY